MLGDQKVINITVPVCRCLFWDCGSRDWYAAAHMHLYTQVFYWDTVYSSWRWFSKCWIDITVMCSEETLLVLHKYAYSHNYKHVLREVSSTTNGWFGKRVIELTLALVWVVVAWWPHKPSAAVMISYLWYVCKLLRKWLSASLGFYQLKLRNVMCISDKASCVSLILKTAKWRTWWSYTYTVLCSSVYCCSFLLSLLDLFMSPTNMNVLLVRPQQLKWVTLQRSPFIMQFLHGPIKTLTFLLLLFHLSGNL